MREPHRQPSSYFSFSPKRHQSPSSTPPVSPGASIERPSPMSRQSPNLRRPSTVRTGSEYSTAHPRVKVSPIEEDGVYSAKIPDQVLEGSGARRARWSSETRTSLGLVLRSPQHSTDSAPLPLRATRDHKNVPTARPLAVTESLGRPKLGYTWTRTKSGSVWYQRLKGSSSYSRQSSSPSQEVSVPSRPITPLKPPIPLSMSRGPSVHHQVKVETSFTSLHNGKSASLKEPPSPKPPHFKSRRSSINPLRLFSHPFYLVRNLSLPKRQKQPHSQQVLTPGVTSIAHGAEMQGHKSLLKRIYTSEALREVTSLLHEVAPQSGTCSPVTVLKPIRHASDQTSSSKGSKQQIFRLESTKDLIPSGAGLSRRSTQDLLLDPIHSYSTSQLEFRMGAQPANTPDENATYKIKRSPSAESEEFLKVDISSRGGTSYLPSEARRIHTPPLPNEGPDGKRRGFFFDYTAPSSVHGRQVSRTGLNLPLYERPSDIGPMPSRSTSEASTVHRRTFSPRIGGSIRRARRAKTCDWYDAKLAEIETSDDEDTEHSKRQGLGRERSATTRSGASLAEVKKKREAEMCDASIPEHLPSSPLCPRHPRYWRVVQGGEVSSGVLDAWCWFVRRRRGESCRCASDGGQERRGEITALSNWRWRRGIYQGCGTRGLYK